ncbi:MAG: hypothetical protein U1F33_13560 [Alphaproteobacteria bacterium]|mgnify:CR=1 FL=1
MIRVLATLALALLVLPTPIRVAAAGEVVVIASDEPGLAVGAIVDGETSVEIAAGRRVTIVTGSGRTIPRTGPYKGPLAGESGPADRSLLDALASLVSTGKRGGAELGAIRAPRRSRDAWEIDIARAGDQCVREGTLPLLWRADSSRQESLVIGGAKDAALLTWPAKAATLPWPAEIDLADGTSYLVRLGAEGEERRLIIHVVPNVLGTDARQAAWMAERGCVRQARLVLSIAPE